MPIGQVYRAPLRRASTASSSPGTPPVARARSSTREPAVSPTTSVRDRLSALQDEPAPVVAGSRRVLSRALDPAVAPPAVGNTPAPPPEETAPPLEETALQTSPTLSAREISLPPPAAPTHSDPSITKPSDARASVSARLVAQSALQKHALDNDPSSSASAQELPATDKRSDARVSVKERLSALSALQKSAEDPSPPPAAAPVPRRTVTPSALEVTAPVTTAPVTTAPVAAAPVAAAPVAAAPVAAVPVAAAATSVAATPVAVALVATAPVATASVATAPVATAPVATALVATAPVATAPVATNVSTRSTTPQARRDNSPVIAADTPSMPPTEPRGESTVPPRTKADEPALVTVPISPVRPVVPAAQHHQPAAITQPQSATAHKAAAKEVTWMPHQPEPQVPVEAPTPPSRIAVPAPARLKPSPVPAPRKDSTSVKRAQEPRISASKSSKACVVPGKILIIYYTTYGHVKILADSVCEGIESVPGCTAELYQVPETLDAEVLKKMNAPPRPNDPILTYDLLYKLREANGIMFGIPTRFGSMPAQLKQFFDSTMRLWTKGDLMSKPAGMFFSTATQAGGQETTAMTTLTQLVHHGMVYVPPGYSFGAAMFDLEVHGGSPWGSGTIAGGDGSRMPSKYELSFARHQGAQFASIALKLAP